MFIIFDPDEFYAATGNTIEEAVTAFESIDDELVFDPELHYVYSGDEIEVEVVKFIKIKE